MPTALLNLLLALKLLADPRTTRPAPSLPPPRPLLLNLLRPLLLPLPLSPPLPLLLPPLLLRLSLLTNVLLRSLDRKVPLLSLPLSSRNLPDLLPRLREAEADLVVDVDEAKRAVRCTRGNRRTRESISPSCRATAAIGDVDVEEVGEEAMASVVAAESTVVEVRCACLL